MSQITRWLPTSAGFRWPIHGTIHITSVSAEACSMHRRFNRSLSSDETAGAGTDGQGELMWRQ